MSAVEFWDGVIEHANDLNYMPTEESRGDIKFTEKILESGFSWIALGKVMRVAAIEMKRVVREIDVAFMTLPSYNEVKEIITTEGPLLIKQTLELSKIYRKDIQQTKNKVHILIEQMDAKTLEQNESYDDEDAKDAK